MSGTKRTARPAPETMPRGRGAEGKEASGDSLRWEAFAQALVRPDNISQTEAAIAAGYAERSAHVAASRLMADPRVLARVKELRAQRAAACDMSADELTRFLVSMARGEVLATIGIAEGCAIEAPPKHADRLKAADMLLKLTGAYPDQKHRVEVSQVPATAEQLRAALEQAQRVEEMRRRLAP